MALTATTEHSTSVDSSVFEHSRLIFLNVFSNIAAYPIRLLSATTSKWISISTKVLQCGADPLGEDRNLETRKLPRFHLVQAAGWNSEIGDFQQQKANRGRRPSARVLLQASVRLEKLAWLKRRVGVRDVRLAGRII